MSLLTRILSWPMECLLSWQPFPKTIYLIFSKTARESSTYIEVCQGAIRAGLKFSFIPFRYNDYNNSKGILSITRQSRLISNIHFVLHLIWCVAQVLMGIHWYSKTAKGTSLSDAAKIDVKWQKIVYFYYPSLGAGTIPIIYLMQKRADELKPLLTVPFQMEQWCNNNGISGYIKNRKLLGVCTFVYSSCLFLPFIYFVASYIQPCLPFVIVSMVTNNCSSWGSPGVVAMETKVVFGMFDYYAWVFLPGVYLGIGWITIVYPGSVSTRRIESIMRDLKNGIEESMSGFREVQIMSGLTNTFWRFPLMQLLLGQWLIAEVIALYTVLRLGGVVPVEIFVYFTIISLDGAALIHVHFKLLSEPCLASTVLFEYRKQMYMGGSKWMRMHVKSCSPYLVKMADGRFFDKTTALVIWQFVTERLVMCLLM